MNLFDPMPHAEPVSPYRRFDIEEWAELKPNVPLPLSEAELETLKGINERVSIEEVEQVYLPISRLLSLYVESVRELFVGTREFLSVEAQKVPFIIGVAGSVAVGKSTVSRILQTLLARWPEHPAVDLISTDGFLLPTRELQQRNLMHRKGFPESFDKGSLLRFLEDVKSGKGKVRAPRYSHLRYDIVPGEFVEVDRPDILIVEGLNVLQSVNLDNASNLVFVSDYFDFSIYLDAEPGDIERWYVERFLKLRNTVFNQPGAYFSHYAGLSEEQARETATEIWRTINLRNLEHNIMPTRNRAKLILHKNAAHRIDQVSLRKI